VNEKNEYEKITSKKKNLVQPMNYENDKIQPGKYINTNTINNKLHPIIHSFLIE